MKPASHQPSFNPFPLAIIALSFAVGILLERLLNLPLMLWIVLGGAMAILSVLFLFRGKHGLVGWLVVIAFALAGASLAKIEREGVGRERVRRFYEDGRIVSGDPVEVIGVLKRLPEVAPDGLYLSIRVDSLRYKSEELRAQGTVELFAPIGGLAAESEYDSLELRRGARVRVMVTLRRAESFRNPGVSSFIEYLDGRGIDATGTIKSPLLVERLDDERVFLPFVWLDVWRGRILSLVNNSFSRETAGVLNAAMLGSKYGLSSEIAERYRAGGTFHVLVISGLHITFIGGFVWFIVRRMTKRRAWQWAVSVIAVWSYALAVGAESSVVRAALMFTLAALAPVLHRESSTLNALGGAALALLVLGPRQLFEPSFQLTFLSVLFIITLAWPLLIKLKDVGEWTPTVSTPYPPVTPRWFLSLGETLFWSERRWKREAEKQLYSYRLFKTPLAARLERFGLQSPLRYGFAAMLVSLCVQLGLIPLLVLYFHRLSLASVLLNLFVGVLLVVLSICAFVALILAQVNASVARPFIWLTERTNWLMAHSVDPFGEVGIAELRLPEYTGWASCVYVFYFVPLIVIAVMLARWNPLAAPLEREDDGKSKMRVLTKLSALGLSLLLIIILVHPLSAGLPDGKLHLHFLDVGQGDAIFTVMPDGTTLLIDGGGRPSTGESTNIDEDNREEKEAEPFERDRRSVGEAVVSEYLWWRGLDHIDYVLATHADADHIDGLNDVVRNFKVRAALVARTPKDDVEFRQFAETLKRKRVPLYTIGRGDVLRFGQTAVAEVLWPPRAVDISREESGNDDSVVLRLSFGERNFLLTGDIERRAETTLVSTSRGNLVSDVVKVAHHGSKTSSTEPFVATTHPSIAVISVGLDSPFGHPDASVVNRWHEIGADVLTTGRSGTITISTDGRELKVSTYVRE